MPYFERTEYNIKKQDPETSSGRQHGWHTQTRLGVIVALILIITTTISSRINKPIFLGNL